MYKKYCTKKNIIFVHRDKNKQIINSSVIAGYLAKLEKRSIVICI